MNYFWISSSLWPMVKMTTNYWFFQIADRETDWNCQFDTPTLLLCTSAVRLSLCHNSSDIIIYRDYIMLTSLPCPGAVNCQSVSYWLWSCYLFFSPPVLWVSRDFFFAPMLWDSWDTDWDQTYFSSLRWCCEIYWCSVGCQSAVCCLFV